MSELAGKVAVVTGASTPKGIGSAIARRFAQAGAAVFLVAEGTRAELDAARDACRAYPLAGRIECGEFDLAQEGAAERMIADAESRFGRIDVLVNNAGIRIPKDFGEFTRADFDRLVSINLAAAFFASQSVLPVMRRQGGGRIINMASQLGHVTYAKRALYGLAKAALIHLTKSMAYELTREGILVNAISPGPVATQPVLDRVAVDPVGEQRRTDAYLPAGRLGDPAEVAEVALFLASTPARFLVGTDIVIDGGYTAH